MISVTRNPPEAKTGFFTVYRKARRDVDISLPRMRHVTSRFSYLSTLYILGRLIICS
jgi:hypothetical protein